jgi:hypothetical protein
VPAPSTRPGAGAVALWTSADLPGLGDQLLGRVIEQELLARLPGWRTTLYAPLGWDRPSVTDGGLVAEPLGVHSHARATQLADAATLSVVCPTFPAGISDADFAERYGGSAAAPFFTVGLGTRLAARHPVLPFAVRIADPVPEALTTALAGAPRIVVRDAASAERLRAAGVERDITVVAHPGTRLDRVVDAATLPVRVAQLRQLGLLPDGDYVVADPSLAAAARAALDATVVPLPTGVDAGPDTLPADLVFEDRLAVLAGATAVVAADEHVAAAAAGLGATWVLVDRDGTHRVVAAEFGAPAQLLDSPADLAGAVKAARDVPPRDRTEDAAAYDRLAAIAERAHREGGALDSRAGVLAAENAALRQAHAALRQRMLVERQRLAEPLAQAWRERDDAVAEAAAARAESDAASRHNAELAARVAHLETELTAWQNTKLVRWTKPLRQAYGKTRG